MRLITAGTNNPRKVVCVLFINVYEFLYTISLTSRSVLFIQKPADRMKMGVIESCFKTGNDTRYKALSREPSLISIRLEAEGCRGLLRDHVLRMSLVTADLDDSFLETSRKRGKISIAALPQP